MTGRTERDPVDSAALDWEAHWPEAVRHPARTTASLLRAHGVVTARCNGVLAQWGLTLSRYEALLDVHHADGAGRSLSQLALRLDAAPAKITKVVDGLVRAGLVERRAHPTDRRGALAAVTPMGEHVAVAATEALAAIEFGLADLDGGQVDALLAVTRTLRGRPALRRREEPGA